MVLQPTDPHGQGMLLSPKLNLGAYCGVLVEDRCDFPEDIKESLLRTTQCWIPFRQNAQGGPTQRQEGSWLLPRDRGRGMRAPWEELGLLGVTRCSECIVLVAVTQ